VVVVGCSGLVYVVKENKNKRRPWCRRRGAEGASAPQKVLIC